MSGEKRRNLCGHLVIAEARAVLSTFRAADTGVLKLRDDLPPAPWGRGMQFLALVLDCLLIRAHPQIESSRLGFDIVAFSSRKDHTLAHGFCHK
jgi:hypothetical protein